MAGIEDAFLNSYRQKAINQLVPGRSIGNRFSTNLAKSQKEKDEMFSGLGFKNYDLGSGETPIGAAGLGLAEGFLNIPSALANLYKDIKSPIDAGVSTIGEALFDPTLVQGGRDKIAEKFAKDTSGVELGLPTVFKNILDSNPVIGQTLKQRADAEETIRKEIARTDKTNAGEFASVQSDASDAAKNATMDLPGEFEAEQAAIEQAKKESTQLGDMSQEGAEMEVITPEMREPVLTEAELIAKKQKDAFTNLIASVNEETGIGSKKEGDKPKTIEDYKAEFAKATGIDVSGEPDNKMALMSLGLSLMQNRAGKGFDLSKILGSVGEAGQKAMPAFEKARQEARAGQVASGKFALQQTKADKDAVKSANTERAKYLRGRRDVILDRIAETATDQQKAYTKFKFDEAIEFLKQGKKSDKYSQIKTRSILEGNNVLKVDFGYQGTKPMYANPVLDVGRIVDQRSKIGNTLKRIDKFENVIKELYEDTKGNIGGSAGDALFNKAVSTLAAFGIGDAESFFGKSGVSPQSKAQDILNILIQENKRFILKESGNGVSNQDKEDLKDAFGALRSTRNLKENLNALKEIRGLFDAPLQTLDTSIQGFIDQKDMYQNDKVYNATIERINKNLNEGFEIKSGSGNNARRINVSD
mgnify:FL=1